MIHYRLSSGLYCNREDLPESLRKDVYDHDVTDKEVRLDFSNQTVPYYELISRLLLQIDDMEIRNTRIDEK